MATRKKRSLGSKQAAGNKSVVAALKQVRTAQKELKKAEALLLKVLMTGPGGTQDGSG
jgi:hypothetical protein